MRLIFLLVIQLTAPFFLYSQPQVVINQYAAVLDYDSCENFFNVDTANQFFVGDTVLIIQMKGSIIDTSNSANFGNVLSYNNAGKYEYNVIRFKSGNRLIMNFTLQNSYDFTNGKVQLVRVPSPANYSIIQKHTCRSWDGTKGGVFALYVSGSLTMMEDIDVSGKGFKPGIAINGSASCNQTDYFFPSTLNHGGEKGEGIADLPVSKMYGRGALANGGGGGNDHNSGGAGGGNEANGGQGGFQHQYGGCPTSIIFNIGGVGGKGLAYNNTGDQIFLGGGGGAGHGNNYAAKDGGQGGGIIIITAANITGNNRSIQAKGSNAPECAGPGSGCQDDGGGGGGAGGTVLLRTDSIANGLQVDVQGGKGSSVYSSIVTDTVYKIGPGGGGSGGVIYLKNPTLQSNINPNLNGGLNGTLPQFSNTNYGAQPGQAGTVFTNLNLNFPTDTFKVGTYNVGDSLVACKTLLFEASRLCYSTTALFLWNFGDGSTGTGNPVTHYYSSAGTYTVAVYISSGFGYNDTVYHTVQVNDVSGTIQFVSDTICAGMPLNFNATASGQSPFTYLWNFGDGGTSVAASGTHNYTSTGAYTVTLIVRNNSLCADTVSQPVFVGGEVTTRDTVSMCRDSSFLFGTIIVDTAGTFTQLFTSHTGCDSTVVLTVQVDDVSGTIQFVSDTICAGMPLNFNATASGQSPFTYLWNFGDGGTSIAASGTHNYASTGAYTVTLIVRNNSLCADTVSQPVFVSEGVSTRDTVSMCRDSSFLFGTIMVDTAGTFTQLFTSQTGCDSTVVLTVSLLPQPTVDFNYTLQDLSPVSFTNISQNGLSFFWDFGDGTTATETNPNHTYQKSGNYLVCLTGWNADGCSSKICKQFHEDVFSVINVPTAFSPNSDGVNDRLFVRGTGVLDLHFRIYNRWGQLIYESRSLQDSWDGTYKGQPLDLESVAYVLDAVLANGLTVHRKGNITIVR